MVYQYKRRKYAKRYGKRRLRKSKYGKFRRGVRSAIRKHTRNQIIVPTYQRAPNSCFLKIRQVRTFALQNIGTSITTSFQIRGNALHDQFVGIAGDWISDKAMVYAMMYNKYYVYASKVRVTSSQTQTNTNSIPQSLQCLFIIPRPDSTAIGEQQLNYDDTTHGVGAPAELWSRSHFKYFNHIQFGEGPKVIKHKMTTKKMFVKNTKTDDDYTGSIGQNAFTSSTADAVPVFSNPNKMWYWNIGMTRPDLVPGGGISTGEAFHEFVIVDVTSYVRFYSTIAQNRIMDDQ